MAAGRGPCGGEFGGGKDVAADVERGDVIADQVAQFSFGELRRIADDGAGAAAQRQVEQRALQGHLQGERAQLGEVGVGREHDRPQAAGARAVVLDAQRGAGEGVSGVAPQREIDRDLAFRVLETLHDPVFEVERAGRLFELRSAIEEGILFHDFGRQEISRIHCDLQNVSRSVGPSVAGFANLTDRPTDRNTAPGGACSPL